MVASSGPPRNAFVRAARKVYNGIGFSKGYNFVLFVIFGGAFLGFTLARLQYLNFYGIFCNGGQAGAAPGECYWYTSFLVYKVGIILHLSGILPAALLAIFQFIPIIRYKALLFHRLNGWVILLLLLCANAGAIMVAPHAFGGDLSVQAGTGTLVIITTLGLAMAIYNVKRLQIDQHRAWMLRTWFYFGSIITLRLIQILATIIISTMSRYRLAMECAKLDYIIEDRVEMSSTYPDCIAYFNGTQTDQAAVVQADFNGSVEQIGASLDMTFGMAMWLALWLHAMGVEIYLHLTPREAERLRQVSYEKQLEAGFKHAGSAGLTSDRLGDAEKWQPMDRATGDKDDVATKGNHGTST